MYTLTSTNPEADTATIRRLVPGGTVLEVGTNGKRPLVHLQPGQAHTVRAAGGIVLDLKPHLKGAPVVLLGGVEIPESAWLPELRMARGLTGNGR